MAIHSFHCLLFLLFIMTVSGRIHHDNQNYCREERCGKTGPIIRFPFRLNNSQQPNDCGYPGFTLFCHGDKTMLDLPVSIMRKENYFVQKIDYRMQEIKVRYDFEVGEYSTRLLPLIQLNNLSMSEGFPFEYRGNKSSYSLLDCFYSISESHELRLVPSNNSLEGFIDCSKMYEINAFPDEVYKRYLHYGNEDSWKFPLNWSKPDCRACEARNERCVIKKDATTRNDIERIQCFVPKKGKSTIPCVIRSTVFMILASSVSGLVVITAIFYVYFLYKKDKEERKRIEMFLKDYFGLKPSRYTYADIKKITNNLKDKLGQGAYGTVFKGKLSNEVSVAVKILNSSKGNGEEFINEVATMGQIHHVNVVRLVGYCAEGLTRALVYEFLPNGSLEKYILPLGSKNSSLCWDMLQDIALGIAKGIEYLHQGCDQRILHFDIKPQNVLLDQNFVPKISDFGLAKLCSKDQSLVSMTTARGTMGYIAPEVLTRSFGNVSYKSDVYSFGMLLLEMVGGKKNTNDISTNDGDDIHYPEWIYNLREEGEDLRIDVDEEGDAKIGKKLAIIGLWCIQWHPMSRPTMKAVVQMLEGSEEGLTVPPNPFPSTGSSRRNTKLAPRQIAFELEAIDE